MVKTLKISPAKYKPFKLVTQKTLCLMDIGPGDLYVALKYKTKQDKNSTITFKFPSNYK